ncbi:iron-sulfur cluster carrier protein ApbC [Orrella sp. NBD-18]|uniref:Iron-sulfur cluster carrier protein n=1 Tax=Sheuella amnicola TaxID=2707330 RepID=A0A6B2QXW7_9BURK|nr:iron-sulfur cluster carrier protein ApbC [Sheuella amnicola]NDY83310.1 iron-sulfur cluster carrier protein ApbC [Sheuella amnicola]HBI83772.1 iron-sulfur cluster carrier protein ApbC [Alcaligenaceae bacterium]
MSLTLADVRTVLNGLIDENTGRSIGSIVKDSQIQVAGVRVSVQVVLGYPARNQLDAWRNRIQAALVDAGAASPEVSVTFKVIAHAVQPGQQLVAGVRNIIAVASGKGGVGKSTTTVNLALALQAEGARVGILDADIYGPSIPMLLGVQQRPESADGKTMSPVVGHGIQSNSIGYLISEDSPAIWRGPMVTQALEQLLRQTNWNDLDYLIVDMPPGTGDIALTLSQKVPVVGAVIVTTPQDIALLDARKGLKMFEKVSVPLLGIVENMAVHVCTKCGHTEHIFGEGGGQRMADDYQVDWLGSLPLALSIREQSDAGQPIVVSDPQGQAAMIYRDIARKLAAKISLLPKDLSDKFGVVAVKRT